MRLRVLRTSVLSAFHSLPPSVPIDGAHPRIGYRTLTRLKLMPEADPYRPPDDLALESDQSIHVVSRLSALAPFAFVVLPVLFGLAGFAGYIVLAITLETQPTENEPVLSHGQQAFLISLPICTIISASVGGALAFVFVRQRVLSVVLLLTIALVGWLITRSLWNAQIARYGRDASEVVLYYPPAGYAAASACFALLLLISLLVRHAKHGSSTVYRSL